MDVENRDRSQPAQTKKKMYIYIYIENHESVQLKFWGNLPLAKGYIDRGKGNGFCGYVKRPKGGKLDCRK